MTFSVSTQPDGATPSGIVNYAGTYSYLITPDDGNGDPIEAPIPAFVYSDVTQPALLVFIDRRSSERSRSPQSIASEPAATTPRSRR